MGRVTYNMKHFFIFAIVAIVLAILLFCSFGFSVINDLETYSGASVKNIDTLSTRSAFVTDIGDVYITGNYYRGMDVSLGLRGIKEWAYKKTNNPVKIFGKSADYVLLTRFGGFINSNLDLYVFSNEKNTFETPFLVTDDCLIPVNAFDFDDKGYCVLYVDNNNRLILKSTDQNWNKCYMSDVLNCKYYENGAYIIHKTDGSLWFINAIDINNLCNEASFVKVSDNVQSFAYSSMAKGGQGIQNNFVILSKNNKVYKKFGLESNLQEIYDNAEGVGLHKQNIIVLTPEKKMVCISDNETAFSMKCKDIESFSASDDVVCAYSKTEGLLFWGVNKYNSFGCKSERVVVELYSEPIKADPNNQG